MVRLPASKIEIKQLEDIATLKADTSTMKADIRDIRDKIDKFITAADGKYATKEEVRVLRADTDSNTNRLWKLSKEVAQWGTLVVALSKLAGMW